MHPADKRRKKQERPYQDIFSLPEYSKCTEEFLYERIKKMSRTRALRRCFLSPVSLLVVVVVSIITETVVGWGGRQLPSAALKVQQWKIPQQRRVVGRGLVSSDSPRRRRRDIRAHSNSADSFPEKNGVKAGSKLDHTTLHPTSVPLVLSDEVARLQEENQRLREALTRVEMENSRLHHEFDNRIVLEVFEGEGKQKQLSEAEECSLTLTGEEMLGDKSAVRSNTADTLEQGACPIEPDVSFGEALRDRAYWLVGLLILQSCSGIILAQNEALLTNHPVSELTP